MNQFGLSPETIGQIQSVLAHYPVVEQAILYGSRAKGNYRAGSDIDLTLRGNISHHQLLAIQNELDDLLLPYSLDLSLFNTLSYPPLLDHIQRVGVIFYVASLHSEGVA